METYDFTERTQLLIGVENLRRLSAASILIFGVGGVGSYCVEALARCGVGRLTLVDGDRVNLSNLNRQLIALRSTVGMFKCEAAKNRILDINPEAQVEIRNVFYTAENADSLQFECFDYVADAVDMVSAKLQIIEHAKRAGVPVISAMGAGNRLNPCQFMIRDIYETKDCPLARVMRRELRARQITDLKVVCSEEVPYKEYNDTDRTIGSISFVPAAAGLAMASQIVKDLCKFKKTEAEKRGLF